VATLSEQPSVSNYSTFLVRLNPELDRELRKIVLASGRSRNSYLADLIARDVAAQHESSQAQA
jgi:hypothetical protein